MIMRVNKFEGGYIQPCSLKRKKIQKNNKRASETCHHHKNYNESTISASGKKAEKEEEQLWENSDFKLLNWWHVF